MSKISKKIKKKKNDSFRNFDNNGEIIKFKFLPENFNKKIFEMLDDSEPTDVIIFHSEEESAKLLKKWKKADYKNSSIPTDIIFKKTIPIYDFILEYDIDSEFGRFNEKYRFFIDKDFEKGFDENNNYTFIGVIVIELDSHQFFNLLKLEKDSDFIINSRFIGFREQKDREIIKNIEQKHFNNYV